MIDLSKIRAIDVHVHADVPCHEPEDPVMGRFFDAASAYFKVPRERPRIPEIISHYREQQIAFCLFTVDCESSIGAKRVSNYEIAEYAAKNDDIVIPLASIDPRKGRMGAHEARDLIEKDGVRGFKFHGIRQNIHPDDPVAYPLYEVIAGNKMLFGSDFPLIRPEKWLEAAQQVGFKAEVLPGIVKDNAARLLGLA